MNFKKTLTLFLAFVLLIPMLRFSTSAANGETEVVLNGTYYIKNIEYSGKYLQIDDNDGPNFNTEGQHMEIWAFNGGEEQQWVITYLSDIGYHTIISVKSGKALSVQPAYVNKADKALVQYNYDDNNIPTQLWKIYQSLSGGYIFRPKSGEGGSKDWCMCVGDYLFPVYDGRNVEQRKYVNNTSYKDEWSLIELKYGTQKYRNVTVNSINCHGYAMIRDDWPTDWTNLSDQYLSVVLNNLPNYLNLNGTDFSSSTKSTYANKVKIDFENWLSSNGYTYQYESYFSSNGEYITLPSNQYRVVLRTGLYFNLDNLNNTTHDYHFWYQISNGTWANKHGSYPSEHLAEGIIPSSSSTSGWNLSSYSGFYDSQIYCYIITVS